MTIITLRYKTKSLAVTPDGMLMRETFSRNIWAQRLNPEELLLGGGMRNIQGFTGRTVNKLNGVCLYSA